MTLKGICNHEAVKRSLVAVGIAASIFIVKSSASSNGGRFYNV
jgi:hypothetical protein